MNFTTPLNTADLFKTAYTKFYKLIYIIWPINKNLFKGL